VGAARGLADVEVPVEDAESIVSESGARKRGREGFASCFSSGFMSVTDTIAGLPHDHHMTFSSNISGVRLNLFSASIRFDP
jgi:hypothetical protein